MKTTRLTLVVLTFVLSVISTGALASTWNWSFSSESGQFITDGLGYGPGSYNLIDFSVTNSSLGSTIGSFLGGSVYR